MPENMSKPTKRKITVEPSVNKSKDSQRRPSVFERLGTKATTTSSGPNQANNDNFCRHWAQNGNCQYGKNCKYANTHTLISPSKRAAKKEGDTKQKQGHNSSSKVINKDDVNKRLHSTVVVKKTHSPDLNWENWDQTDLEYEDEKVLEKRRQLLQRELELQMKREKEEQQRQKKDKKTKKGISSSSSTSASSSSSTESTSSSDDSSSTSSSTSGDSRRRKGKNKKSKRDSSSSASETDHVSKKKPNRSGKVPVKSTSPSMAVKKAVVPRRGEEPRPSGAKRREPSPRKTAPPPPPPTKQAAQPVARRRSLTPNGRSSSGHRRRSQTPPHKNKAPTASRSSLGSKQTGVKHNQSPRPNRSLSLDRKDKHNRSVSPRATARDRDRDREREREREREKEKEREREREKERDKEKEREREREKEKEREKEREREKEKEKEREREREREKEKEREKERIRSRSPKVKGKDRLSRSPRRNSRPPKDVRKKDSPDSGTSKDKGYRVSPAKSRGSVGGGRGRDSSHDSKRNVGKTSPRDSDRRDTRDTRDSWGKHSDARKDHDRGREKEDDRKKDDRDGRRDAPDRGARDGKDRGSRETTLERGGGSRSLKDEGGGRRDDNSGRKRESQMLPGIVEKTAQDRDYIPKGRDHGDNDRDRDRERDRGRDSRDISRDNRDGRDMRDNRDGREMKDGLDRNVGHDSRSTRESREAAREKEREEALERCRERQREREREKELSKAREYEREIPSLLTMMTHKPITMQQTPSLLPSRSSGKGSGLDRGLDTRSDRDRGSDRDRDRDRGLDRVPERDRGLDRGSERDRGSDRERGLDRGSDRDRGSNRGLDRDRGHSRDRDRDRGVDRLSDRDRGLDRSSDRDRPSDRDRGLDRNMGRGSERLDRSSERGLARGSERTSDRGLERSSERVMDRGLDRGPLERGLERGFDRSAERSYDRGSERSLDRGFDRGIERSSHLDRDRDREGRDSHSDRDYPLSSRSRDSDGRRPPPEDKGYDSPFEGRRGRDDRSRYSDQLDRNRYDDAPSQREDPRSLVDRRLGVDPRGFSEDRRGRREGRNSMEPLRGSRDPWDGHERDRDRDPRDREPRERDRDIHERDLRDRDRGRGYDREEPRSSGSSIKGRDWESREYSESRREWDGRGRRGAPPEWENSHRAEWGEKDVAIPIAHALPHGIPPIEGEWGCFPGPPPGDWTPGDRRGGWVDEWSDRSALGGMVPPIGLGGPSAVIAGRPPPRMLPHRDDAQLLLLPRDVKEELPHDESGKKLHEEVKEKELADLKDEKAILEGMKLDESSLKKMGETPESTSSLKRSRDVDSDVEKPEAKKICLDESANLEEDLSDISDDDADEILNREDSVEDLGVGVDGNDVALALSEGPSTPLYHRGTEEHPEMLAPSGMMMGETGVSNSVSILETAERDESSITQDGNRDVMDAKGMLMSNQLEDRPQDEETMDNLDFEEISDEELEEEARAGIGDALGVDWASLVAESRPRARTEATPGSARRRWESHRILSRLGVSARYAGWELMEELKTKLSNVKEEKEENVKRDNADVKFEQEVKQEIKQDEQDIKPEEAAGTEEKENQKPKAADKEHAIKEQNKSTFLHPVAMIHVAIKERKERRKALFASSGPYKRALSARRDLAIRRQLCNLPVKETAGDAQQPGPDVELYRLGVQLFERSL